MQTYSHLIITAGLSRVAQDRTDLPVRSRAFLLGSVMPDVPLFLLTIGFFISTRYLNPPQDPEFIFGPTYDTLYFTDPIWVASHNFFHSPPMILAFAALGWWAWKQGRGWGLALLWFAAGCGLHSFIDILTHHNDGPLLLFPFNWELRFQSPVSYWDPDHYGRIFAPFEHLLDLAILGYLWWVRRQRRAPAAEAPA